MPTRDKWCNSKTQVNKMNISDHDNMEIDEEIDGNRWRLMIKQRLTSMEWMTWTFWKDEME